MPDNKASAVKERILSIRPKWYRSLQQWIWGYDFFVCYDWDSGGAYAVQLAAMLRERGYDVFLDRSEYAMGDKWMSVGELALRNTQRLILIATDDALSASEAVSHELRQFAARKRHCIPIVFSSNESHLLSICDKLQRHSVFSKDSLHIAEAIDRLALGPSATALDALVSTHKLIRRRRVRQVLTWVFVGLLAASLGVVLVALRNENRAKNVAIKGERRLYDRLIAFARREWERNQTLRTKQLLQAAPAHLRDERWEALKDLCDSEVAELHSIGDATFSADGSRVIVGKSVFDIRTGHRIESEQIESDRPLRKEKYTVSPTGEIKVLVDEECGVSLVRMENSELVCSIPGKKFEIREWGVLMKFTNPYAVFSRDGKWVAAIMQRSGSSDGIDRILTGVMLTVIDVDKCEAAVGPVEVKENRPLEFPGRRSVPAIFSPDSRRLAYISGPTTVRVVTLGNPDDEAAISTQRPIWELKWASNEILACSTDDAVIVQHLDSAKESLEISCSGLFDVEEESLRLAAIVRDPVPFVEVWDCRRLTRLFELHGDFEGVNSVQIGGGGRALITAGGRRVLWRLPSNSIELDKLNWSEGGSP